MRKNRMWLNGRQILIIVINLVLIYPFLAFAGGAGGVAISHSPMHADFTNQLIVKLRDPSLAQAPALSSERTHALSALAGIALTHFRAMSGNSHVFKLPRHMTLDEVKAVARRLEADPGVEYAEPDAVMLPLLTPNDTLYPDQWHYKTSGAPDNEKGGANLPGAWDITTGSNSITVAVIDTGIVNHEDIQGRTVPGYNFISDPISAGNGIGRTADPSDLGDWQVAGECPGDPYARPSTWHGTHVAGTIGAVTNNSKGVAGINRISKVLPVRVLGKCGGYTSDIVDGMRWAAGLSVTSTPTNTNPARVLNLSLGGGGRCNTTYQNAINDIVNARVVVVVAAGNSNANAANYQPASCNGVISVAAVNRTGGRASYSNFGTTVKIAAPGGEMSYAGDTRGILSTLNTGTTTPVASPDGDTYQYYQGTSMAAPHASGIISLLLSVNPTLSPTQVLQTLQATARIFPTGTGSSGGDCTTALCGAGIVDASSLVLQPAPADTTPPVTMATASGYTFGTWTATSPISITLAASDGTGSGVATGYPKYCVDNTNTCTPSVTYSAPISQICTAGTTCTWYVRYQSVDVTGNPESVKISQVKQDLQTPTDGTPSASAGNGQVSMSWSGFSDSGSGLSTSDAYKVVYLTTGYPNTQCANGTDITAITTQTSYLHTGLTNGTPYYYRICAKDSMGNISAGTTASATPFSSVNSAPTIPTLNSPLSSSETATQTPVLKVNASTDPDGDPITYTVALSTASDFSVIVASASGITASGGLAAWTVSPSLSDNTLYYWRALANDGKLNSAWMPTANFFVNTANDPPTNPTVSSPINNVHVATFTPVLSITNATDEDIHDTITYDFTVALDGGFLNIFASISGVASGTGGTTSWTVTPALSEDTPCYWRVRARDNHGATSSWVSASFFVNTTNSAPAAPTVSAPANASEVVTFTPILTVNNATDSDRDTLHYVFEIDTVNTFNSASKQTSGLLAEGAGSTSWNPASLTENTTYYWRVKANDGLADGPWMDTTNFFVNTVNDSPTVPTLNNPSNGGQVTVSKPTLQVNAATDLDKDTLTYEFQVFSSSTLTSLVTGTTGAGTSWVVDAALNNNSTYWWIARAKDQNGLVGNWMAASSFFVNNNGYNDPPAITITKPDVAEPVFYGGIYDIKWTAADPDSVATISLGYDTTGAGCNGTQIVTGIQEHDGADSYAWDTTALVQVTYNIYAIITDGTTTVCSYSISPLTKTDASGDVNGDGIVNIVDVLRALRIAAGLIQPTAADLAHSDVAPLVNGKPQPDGKIDIGDVVVMLRRTVGLMTW